MAYEFLKKLFGKNEDGSEKAMTFVELEAAIDAAEGLKVINLEEGGYVAKTKLDDKITELKDTKKLLEEANTTIQTYKDMDVDGIKQSVADWENKYNTDLAALQDKMAKQETEFAAKEYFGKYNFTSELAKKAAFAEFMAQEFKRSEDGKFLGADDWMESMKASNPGAFVVETPNPTPVPEPPKPSFAPKGTPTPPHKPREKKMTLTEKMKYMQENPGTDIDSLFD